MMRIDTKTGRAALAGRREPYWHKHARDRHLGLRKAEGGAGSWIARYRGEDGKRLYAALGEHSDTFGFDQAMAKALAWFREIDRAVRAEAETVGDVCRLYVEDRRKQRGAGTEKDYQRAFENGVYGGGKKGDKHEAKAIAAVPLAKIRSRHLRAWRDGLVDGCMTRTANRMRTRLIAALNYAVRERYVSADVAQEWRSVEPFKGAGKRRDLYLDLPQRRALLAAAEGAVRHLIEGVMVTGVRVGEWVNATRGQFDGRTKTMKFIGKTGTRVTPLAPAALALFTRLSKDKLPGARLFVRDDGRPWAHSDWDELVRAAATKAELPKGVCLYSCRHAFVTTAITSGMSTLDVARLTGTSLTMAIKILWPSR